jgi:hypothetical protein
MGLVVWLCTVIAERLNRTPLGRKITTGVAVFVIAYFLIIVIGLLNLTIAAALGYYP